MIHIICSIVVSRICISGKGKVIYENTSIVEDKMKKGYLKVF